MPPRQTGQSLYSGTRILSSDDTPPLENVPWRRLDASTPLPVGTAPAAEPEPDIRARLAEMERQYQEKVRQARAAGVAEGEAAGKARASAEVQPVLERLAQTIAEISGLRGRLRREAEADTIQLALAIAKRVLRRELAVDPEALHGLLLGALEKLESREISRVRVHPSHAGVVRGFLGKMAGGEAVEVLPDARCEAGTVIFETGRGNLDASIETQFQEIERGLADCLRRRA